MEVFTTSVGWRLTSFLNAKFPCFAYLIAVVLMFLCCTALHRVIVGILCFVKCPLRQNFTNVTRRTCDACSLSRVLIACSLGIRQKLNLGLKQTRSYTRVEFFFTAVKFLVVALFMTVLQSGIKSR